LLLPLFVFVERTKKGPEIFKVSGQTALIEGVLHPLYISPAQDARE
jgi:hypothetical protein